MGTLRSLPPLPFTWITRPPALVTSHPFYTVLHGVQRKSPALTASSTARELVPKIVKIQHLSPRRVDKRGHAAASSTTSTHSVGSGRCGVESAA